MSSTLNALSASSASPGTLIAARWYDYIPIAIYFAFVIGVGLIARAKAATSDGFLTSGRSLPAWVTGIAFRLGEPRSSSSSSSWRPCCP